MTYTHATVTEGGVFTDGRALGETSLTGEAERREYSGLRSRPSTLLTKGTHRHTHVLT